MSNLMKLEESVVFSLRKLYHKYGYTQFKMRKFEPYDLYMQNKEFLVSDGVITFTDTDGTLMALKPDVTLSIVKNFRPEATSVQKVCYDENVYRIAGASRSYREIMQTGLECLGDVGLYEISEVITLAAQSLSNISTNYVLDISHMGIVSQLLNSLSLCEDELTNVLHFIGEKNSDALSMILGADKSRKILELLSITGSIADALPKLKALFPCSAIADLETLYNLLSINGVDQNIHLDFSIISDRNYYNDFVFRGYVDGIPTAVLAGGQYDCLMQKMNKNAKGIGFAVYLDQLELLESRCNDYDVDTILLYDNNDDPISLAKALTALSQDNVFLTKELPKQLKYRAVMKFKNGRFVDYGTDC